MSIGLVIFNTLYSVTVTAQFIDSSLKYMFQIWRESAVRQHWLLFQKIWIQILALTQQLTTVLSSTTGSNVPFWPPRTQGIRMIYR